MWQSKTSLISLVLALMATATWANFDHAHISWADRCEDDADFSPYVKMGSKYYLIEGALRTNWYDAAQHCRRSGGYLVDIESDAELAALNAALMQTHGTKPQHFWISGNDLSVEGQFHSTSTGHQLAYYNWSPGQPDNHGNAENCMTLMYRDADSYLMNDQGCGAQNFFICELKPQKVMLSVW